jgi:hypothetical protein
MTRRSMSMESILACAVEGRVWSHSRTTFTCLRSRKSRNVHSLNNAITSKACLTRKILYHKCRLYKFILIVWLSCRNKMLCSVLAKFCKRASEIRKDASRFFKNRPHGTASSHNVSLRLRQRNDPERVRPGIKPGI